MRSCLLSAETPGIFFVVDVAAFVVAIIVKLTGLPQRIDNDNAFKETMHFEGCWNTDPRSLSLGV
jgi:hypothetical protein